MENTINSYVFVSFNKSHNKYELLSCIINPEKFIHFLETNYRIPIYSIWTLNPLLIIQRAFDILARVPYTESCVHASKDYIIDLIKYLVQKFDNILYLKYYNSGISVDYDDNYNYSNTDSIDTYLDSPKYVSTKMTNKDSIDTYLIESMERNKKRDRPMDDSDDEYMKKRNKLY